MGACVAAIVSRCESHVRLKATLLYRQLFPRRRTASPWGGLWARRPKRRRHPDGPVAGQLLGHRPEGTRFSRRSATATPVSASWNSASASIPTVRTLTSTAKSLWTTSVMGESIPSAKLTGYAGWSSRCPSPSSCPFTSGITTVILLDEQFSGRFLP